MPTGTNDRGATSTAVGSPGSDHPLLAITGLSKTFPGQRALDDVTMSVAAGEIHALIGQNGCGKSTLLKILTGYHRPDPGATVLVRGTPASFHELKATVPIRAVHQDLGIIPELNAMDNLALGTAYLRTRVGPIAWRRQGRHTKDVLKLLGVHGLDPRIPLKDASQVQRTMVAVARAVADWSGRHGLLILDEPSSSLPDHEVEQLGHLVRDLARSGVGIVYVSHSLSEVLGLADRATVLREGRLVATTALQGKTEHDLLELMLGKQKLRQLEELEQHADTPARADPQGGPEPALRVTRLRTDDIRDLSFQAEPGEIVGFAGLAGSGHLDIAYVLGGARRAITGEITLQRHTMSAAQVSPQRAIRNGIALVPPDRATEGAIASMDTSANITLPRLERFRRSLVLQRRRQRAYATKWITDLSIVPDDPAAKVETLSGGNRQKVVLAKWMGIARTVLVLAEPTVGVDIGAKLQIYHVIRQAAATRLAVIVCSTDITDLLAVCDRVIAMSNGRALTEIVKTDLSEHSVLAAISAAATSPASTQSAPGVPHV